jgi:hypothetical protein
MNIGESAGHAAALAQRSSLDVAGIGGDALLREVAEARIMITFFNDIDVDDPSPWVPAVQYFGTKGYFDTYDALPLQDLDEATARLWLEGAEAMQRGRPIDANALAARLAAAPADDPIPRDGFLSALRNRLARRPISTVSNASRRRFISRAEACACLYEALDPDSVH